MKKIIPFVLFGLSVFAFLVGCLYFAYAKGAIHEIEGLILFNMAAIFLTGGLVVDSRK